MRNKKPLKDCRLCIHGEKHGHDSVYCKIFMSFIDVSYPNPALSCEHFRSIEEVVYVVK